MKTSVEDYQVLHSQSKFININNQWKILVNQNFNFIDYKFLIIKIYILIIIKK